MHKGDTNTVYMNIVLVVFDFDFGGEVVADVANLANAVLNHQMHLRRHGEADLNGQTAGLGENVQVPAGKGEGDWFLHLDGHRLFLLVYVGYGN